MLKVKIRGNRTVSKVTLSFSPGGDYVRIPLTSLNEGWLLIPVKVSPSYPAISGRLNFPLVFFQGHFTDSGDILTTIPLVNTSPFEFNLFVVKFGLSYNYPVDYNGYTYPPESNYSYSHLAVNLEMNEELYIHSSYVDVDFSNVFWTHQLKHIKGVKTVVAKIINDTASSKSTLVPIFSSFERGKIETNYTMSSSTMWIYREGGFGSVGDEFYHGLQYAGLTTPANSTREFIINVSLTL